MASTVDPTGGDRPSAAATSAPRGSKKEPASSRDRLYAATAALKQSQVREASRRLRTSTTSPDARRGFSPGGSCRACACRRR
jgi:hypothetical protein